MHYVYIQSVTIRASKDWFQNESDLLADVISYSFSLLMMNEEIIIIRRRRNELINKNT